MSKKKDQEEASEGSQNASAAGAKPGAGEEPSKGAQHPGADAAGAGTGTQGGEQAVAPGPCGSAEDRITVLEAEVADLKDKLLRKQADFENYRKRMLREREDATRYSNAALLLDIIGLIDDFERAIKSAEESNDFPTFLQGISMIERQFIEMLESRWGLKRFSSVGEGFDPNRHEAVLRVEGPVDSKPVVVEDFQKGYYLHERVLRPARVKVMVPAAEPAPAQSGGDAPGTEGQDENSRAGA
jgi:molecular chaperone GrpE